MKHKTARFAAILLIAAAFFALFAPAYAAQPDEAEPAQARSNAYISSYSAGMYAGSGGKVTAYFDIVGTGIMDMIGATAIYIYTSSGSRVATYHYSNYPSFMGYNNYTHSGSVSYQGTVGQKYYCVVYYYSSNSSGHGTESLASNITTAKQ